MLAGLSHEGCCVSLHLIRCCGHGFGAVHASLQANPEGFLVPYKVARGPLCAPVRVVTSLSPYSPRTLTRPRRFGTTWQPLPSGVWATGVPGRCVCVCVLWGGAWEGRQGWREWVPSTIWALGTPWGGRLGQLLPMGALAVQAYPLQTFMSVISSVCLESHVSPILIYPCRTHSSSPRIFISHSLF